MVKVNEINWALVDRSNVVGGTDMSVLLGENKWKTREELVQEKLGHKKVEVNDGMYWGTMAEPMIAKHIENNLPPWQRLYDPEAEPHGHQVEHKDYPFIVGSPDRLILNAETDEVVEGVEIKTAFEWTLKSWRQKVPTYYQIQCQHYMMVTGLDSWRICVLVGNRTYLEFNLEADYLLQEEMIEKAVEFNKEIKDLVDKGAKEALSKYEDLLREKAEEACVPMGKD